jgi:hypothetical protein
VTKGDVAKEVLEGFACAFAKFVVLFVILVALILSVGWFL